MKIMRRGGFNLSGSFFLFYFDKGSADVMKYLSYHVNIHGKLFLMDLKKKILQDKSNVLITGGKLINSFV